MSEIKQGTVMRLDNGSMLGTDGRQVGNLERSYPHPEDQDENIIKETSRLLSLCLSHFLPLSQTNMLRNTIASTYKYLHKQICDLGVQKLKG